jgi:hypothetical protein
MAAPYPLSRSGLSHPLEGKAQLMAVCSITRPFPQEHNAFPKIDA